MRTDNGSANETMNETHANRPLQVAIDELRTLHSDYTSGGLPSRGEFFYYFGLGQVNRAMPHQDPDWKGYGKTGDDFCKRMFILANDFDNIVTLIHKIDWLSGQWQNDQVTEENWAAYVKTDIYSFHAEVRSICDSIAKAIQIASEEPGQTSDSFNGLRELCTKNKERAVELFGDELADLIISADWFSESRHLRDQIIHYERDVQLALTAGTSEQRLLFRTVVGDQPKDVYKGPGEFQYGQDGWILFSPYAGYYFGRLWHFLNEMCRLCGARLNLPKSGFSWVNHRLPVALDHIAKAIERLDSSYTTPKPSM